MDGLYGVVGHADAKRDGNLHGTRHHICSGNTHLAAVSWWKGVRGGGQSGAALVAVASQMPSEGRCGVALRVVAGSVVNAFHRELYRLPGTQIQIEVLVCRAQNGKFRAVCRVEGDLERNAGSAGRSAHSVSGFRVNTRKENQKGSEYNGFPHDKWCIQKLRQKYKNII